MAKSSDSEKSKEKVRGNPLASSEEKARALEAARLQIEKQFGAGSIMKLGNNPRMAGIEVVPSGSILLDEALGIGGYPRGRIIEIFGPESSGKTTLALHAIAEAQKIGGIAAFVDAEHALDPVYAKNLGVNIDELWISQPDTGEQGLEITENLVRSGALDVIVVDSVAALTPQAEIEGDMGDAHMGLQARLMSQALRKLTATIGKSRSVLIFINQIRMKIGVMFGSPETTTGGNALKFYSSVRLEVRKIETIEAGKDEDAIGNRIRVKVIKNKVAPPFRRAELEVIFGKGISAIGSLLDAAVKYDIIDKKGAWFSCGEERIGQGRENAKEYLKNNDELVKDIEIQLRKLMFPGREAPEQPAATGKSGAEKSPDGKPSAGKSPGAQSADTGAAGETPESPGSAGKEAPPPAADKEPAPPAADKEPAPPAADKEPAPPAAGNEPVPPAASVAGKENPSPATKPVSAPVKPAQAGPGRPRKIPAAAVEKAGAQAASGTGSEDNGLF